MVLPSQVDSVKAVLQSAEIPHNVSEADIRMDGKAAISIFNLSEHANVKAIEKVLETG